MGGFVLPGDLLGAQGGNVPQTPGPNAPLPGPKSSRKPSALEQGKVVGQGDNSPNISPNNSPDISPGLCLRTRGDRGGSASRAKCRAPGGWGGNFGLKKGRIG